MKSITKEYEINAPISKVWEALINPTDIEGWNGGPAQMDENEGTEFKLWGGDIWGTNTKVEREKLLEQDWYGGNWNEPSKVKFILSSNNHKTNVKLEHTNIPDNEADSINEGWDSYYMMPLKEYVESK